MKRLFLCFCNYVLNFRLLYTFFKLYNTFYLFIGLIPDIIHIICVKFHYSDQADLGWFSCYFVRFSIITTFRIYLLDSFTRLFIYIISNFMTPTMLVCVDYLCILHDIPPLYIFYSICWNHWRGFLYTIYNFISAVWLDFMSFHDKYCHILLFNARVWIDSQFDECLLTGMFPVCFRFFILFKCRYLLSLYFFNMYFWFIAHIFLNVTCLYTIFHTFLFFIYTKR